MVLINVFGEGKGDEFIDIDSKMGTYETSHDAGNFFFYNNTIYTLNYDYDLPKFILNSDGTISYNNDVYQIQ